MASSAKKRTRGSKASNGKKKRKLSGSDEEEPAFLSSKYAEPPTSKIYNSRFHHKDPAELFRKDLISAMKLPDSEILSPDDYWLILDSWRSEWERGVQVPVYPDALPEPQVRILRKKSKESTFKLPKKLIRFTRNNFFNPEVHFMSYTNTLAERTCRYDMDDVDLQWLTMVNEDREDFGLQPLEEHFVEQIMEELEVQSYTNFQEAIKSEDGLGVEYDEDAICDVCRSVRSPDFPQKPDSQEGNEMVFCDSCNICVHQICYGITKIPEGSWVCRTCALGIRPACVLCPNRGGAMKTTRCGQNWAHVGCAVWIPEVSFLNFVKMEPITKISHIPPSRWALQCSICKDKKGACIQCSEKNCKVAFHVTCAFQEGLQMRASVKLNNTDDDKLQAFCQKHSKKLRGCFSDSEEDENAFNIKKKEKLTSEERANIRQQKIQAKEAEFYNYAKIEDVADMFECDKTDIEVIYNYWKLKRRANWNRALLPPKIDNDNNCSEENSPFVFLKKMVHQRQDLERVRNLCYMAIKRDKLAHQWMVQKREIFMKQVEILSNKSSKLTEEETTAVLNANIGDLAHDKKHTGMNGPSPNVVSVLTTLIGEEYIKTHLNGAMKNVRKSDRIKSERTPNPYAKHYLNGLAKRSQRFINNQKKVSSLQHSLDVKSNLNLSCQNSMDHLQSDEGCDSSKDLHDATVVDTLAQSDSKFECFNANDNAFVNLETYHSSDVPIKEENFFEESNTKADVFFSQLPTFSQSSNDSTLANPVNPSLEDSMFDSESKNKVNSTDEIDCNNESKFCSGYENEKPNFNLAKKESTKRKNKVLSDKSSKSAKKSAADKLCNSISTTSNDASDLITVEQLFDNTIADIDNIKFGLELPIESVIDVVTTDTLVTEEVIEDTNVKIISDISDVKPKLENIDFHNDDKLNSSVQCVIVKSEIPVLPAKSESSENEKIKFFKETETFDKPPKKEATDCSQNVECNKINNDKTLSSVSVKDKDVKIRPSNKDSPLRTLSPTFKATENGVLKGSKSTLKQNSEKLQALSRQLSKSKSSAHSHSSSLVSKLHSSSANKCQEKNSPASSKADDSESLENKDSSKEASTTAPVSRKDMLRNYKIPKKSRSEKPEENSLDMKRGNTPLSPLPDIASSSMSGYHTKGSSWRKLEPRTAEVPPSKPPPPPSRTNMNGDIQNDSSEKIILKLQKDPSDPQSQRWRTEPNNFNRNMGGWVGPIHPHPPPPRLLPPPPVPPFLPHPPPPQRFYRMRSRGGFRRIHMGYHNGPYT